MIDSIGHVKKHFRSLVLYDSSRLSLVVRKCVTNQVLVHIKKQWCHFKSFHLPLLMLFFPVISYSSNIWLILLSTWSHADKRTQVRMLSFRLFVFVCISTLSIRFIELELLSILRCPVLNLKKLSLQNYL